MQSEKKKLKHEKKSLDRVCVRERDKSVLKNFNLKEPYRKIFKNKKKYFRKCKNQ